MNLSTIPLKLHDPHRVIEKVITNVGTKKYLHEDSMYDDIFKGASSYQEVSRRVKEKSPSYYSNFIVLRDNRGFSLPSSLQQTTGEPIMTKSFSPSA